LAAQRAAIRFTERIMGVNEDRAVYAMLVEDLGVADKLVEVSVHTVDAVAGTLTYVAGTGAEPMDRSPRPLGNGIAAEVVRRRVPRCTHDLREQEHQALDEHRFLLMVPVVCDGETTAIIHCEAKGAPSSTERIQELPIKLATLTAMKLMQVRSFQAARLQDMRYRRVIANMDLGLIEVDLDHRITTVNEKLCSMTGWSKHDLVGRQLFEIDGVRASLEVFAVKREARSKGISDAFEATVNIRSGEERHWFVSGAPQTDAEGRYTGSVSVILDITDRRRMERELIDANIKAGEALQTKELFLANMSHEMRTPMNAIVGLCSEMLREETDTVQRDRLGAVITAGNNLMKLMNDLLDASRAAMGMIQLEQVPLDPAACVHQVKMVMRPMALQKGLTMSCRIDPAAHGLLLGDVRRLDQLLLNLMGNALKFTVQGGVELVLDVLESTSTHQRLRFTVRDTGVGIDPRFMPHLFEPFSRDPALVGKAIEGTGLGLSICKHLVDLMQGEIRVNSNLGKGTEVIVELGFPIITEGCGTVVDEPDQILRHPIPGMRILLVEDSAFNRMVVKSMLTGLGVTIDEAEQGAEALSMMCRNAYDVVLLDLRMPLMDGHEFIRVLRHDLRTEVPVVVLTAGDDNEQELLDQGMNVVLRKPLDRTRLLNTLAGCVKQAGGPGGWAPDRSDGEVRFDTAMVHELVGGDAALFREVIAAFLKDAPQNMAGLCQALGLGDMSRIAEVAHRLRPSVRMLNMVDVLDQVDGLVAMGRHPRSPGFVATAVLALVRQLRAVCGELQRVHGEQ
ncbi:MAG: ATP-binding protein, partial [Flavobacteriales bacterium]